MESLQLGHRWRNEFDLFPAESAGFAGMRVQTRDGDPPRTAAAREKILQERTHAHNLGGAQVLAHGGKRKVRGDQGNGESRAREKHGEIFHSAARGEKFRLTGNGNPASYMRALWMGPVTTASISLPRASLATSSRAACATHAPAGVGWPGEWPSASPKSR